ncbi:MAG TPA: alpha-glucosidase [Rikenellaceae bacterium]|nr:alpha-glucosidase [Rikenellaceae bacterium]
MKKHFVLVAIAAAFVLGSCTSRNYMTADGVAVFVPEGFDASQHLPSPIFLEDLERHGCVPSKWKLVPQFSSENGKSVVRINVADADLYGTGEVWGPLRRNGDKNIFWNRDNGAYAAHEGKELYQTHPWVLGLRKDGSSFGIIFDNTWRSELQCDSVITYTSDGPAFRVVVIEKDSPAEVLKTLGRLSGTMEMPPLWALGYQQCRFSYYPDTRVKEVADEFRNRNIPCDVIWMDIHYMDGYRIFTFDPNRFPDPKGLNDYLHARNFKSVYMIDPGAKVDSTYWVDKEGLANDYFVHDADGKPFEGGMWPGLTHWPDFSMPEVREWWAGLYKDFMAQGVDGIWNDVNEPAVFGGGEELTMPDDNIHRGGDGRTAGNHVRYHNVFGYDMVRASRAGILAANPDKRPFVLSRSNFLGGQRYAATWTGDNVSSVEQMKGAVAMTLNMGLSGQAFNGPDVGGFLDDCNPELLAQWTAMGVYFPFLRNHSCDGTVDQEPWAMGPETEAVCRTAINRRYRLLPYIYTLFREASVSGLPVMRPVFWADTRDLSLRAEQDAYLLGGDLLVVPRYAETTAALPQGDWQSVSFEDTDDGYQARLYVRDGAIVPVGKVFQNTVEYNTDELTLLVNLDDEGKAYGTLYEDAGDGFGYKSGEYGEYRIVAERVDGEVQVRFEHVAGQFDKTDRRFKVVNL